MRLRVPACSLSRGLWVPVRPAPLAPPATAAATAAAKKHIQNGRADVSYRNYSNLLFNSIKLTSVHNLTTTLQSAANNSRMLRHHSSRLVKSRNVLIFRQNSTGSVRQNYSESVQHYNSSSVLRQNNVGSVRHYSSSSVPRQNNVGSVRHYSSSGLLRQNNVVSVRHYNSSELVRQNNVWSVRHYSSNGLLRPNNVRLVRQNTGSVKRYNSSNSNSSGVSTSPVAAEVPQSAEVVVIGGGSLGCNALYHLARQGITDTVLLEAHKLTAGTTWHTAGLIWRLRPSDTEIHLLDTTREMLMRLEEETGVNPGWINNGGIFVASSKERLDEYKRLMTVGRVFGVESYLLDPQETKKLYPLMNVDDIVGTLYSPGDGTIDPAGLCEALTRGAKKAGARVVDNCRVTDITTTETLLGGRRVTHVHTSSGTIATNCVINASGAWANDIANMVGLSVPLEVMRHAYVVTEKIKGIENMPNIRDHDLSVYFRLQGDALSIGGYEQNPQLIAKLDPDFSFGLYDLDWDIFDPLIKGHIQRIPVLETTGIKSTVCGPESFTPDHKPIMGEDPEVEGFFHCCGFNSAGMMLGGGCGDQIAKWVKHGRPDLDMFGYDVRRFHTPMFRDREWVQQRSHEAYAKNYSIVFPHDEPLAARNRRKSALHQVLLEAGCVYQERHGWERPGWFSTAGAASPQPYDWYQAYDNAQATDQRYATLLHAEYTFKHAPAVHEQIKAECLSCRNAVAGFDMSYFGKLYLCGPDAAAAADYLFSANIRKPVGTTVYTCMLNHAGGTEADLTVSVLSGGEGSACDPQFSGLGYYLAIGGAAAMQNYAHVVKEIRRHKWNVSLINHTDTMAMFSVQGPNSRALLSTLTDADLSNEEFPFSTHKLITVAGHKARALRVSFVGEMGWELHIPNESAVSIYKEIVEAGKKFGFINSGYRAMDSLSCEKGYRHWHADVRPDDTPLEAGLGFTCKLKTDIPFLGRAAIEKQKAEGLRKKMVTLTMDKNIPLWGLEGIQRNGENVGIVRRAEVAFTLDKNVAYGYISRPDGGVIDKEFLKTGDWSITVMGENHPAQIHLKHPFDPKNERIKGNYSAVN